VPLIILAIENDYARPFVTLYEALASKERMDELLNFIQKIHAKKIDTSNNSIIMKTMEQFKVE